jgi:hypothetical protein
VNRVCVPHTPDICEPYARFAQEMPDQFFLNVAGTTITFGEG